MSHRRLLSAALVTASLFGLSACGGDSATVGAGGDETFTNGSSTEEYCGVLAAANPRLVHDLTVARPASVQPVISAIGDLSTVAPGEIKGDLTLIQEYLQLVVDAGADGASVAPEELAAADAALDEVTTRVVQSAEETCGVTLD